LNIVEFRIKNKTIPLQSLSKKLYTPKTNAPFFPFYPTTSEIKEIPVLRTTAKPIPSSAHTKYIKFFNDSGIIYVFIKIICINKINILNFKIKMYYNH